MKSEEEEKYFAEVWPTLTPEQRREHYLIGIKFLAMILAAKHGPDGQSAT